MRKPIDPHAIVSIERPGFTDGQALVTYDSWEAKRLIKEINVELATNQSSEARVAFFDPKFRVIDTFSGVTAKAVVRIYLGYGQELGEPVFKGILSSIERGESETTMVFYDMAFVMKLVKRSGYKNKKGDIAIIKGLVERNETPLGKKLKFEGPETPQKLEPQHQSITQDQLTDWDWMMERARDAGLVIYVRGDTVFAKYPAKTAAKPALTLRNKVDFNLLAGWDFCYRTPESLEGRPKVVKHRRRGKGGKFIQGASSTATGGVDDTQIKRDMARPSKSKLTKRAQAQKELEREHAFEGHVEVMMPTDGTRLDARNTVAIWGIGKLMSGKYLGNTVNYRFGPGRLRLEIDMYRDIPE